MHAAVKKLSKCGLNFQDAHAYALQEECQLSTLDQGRDFGMNSILNDVHLGACQHACADPNSNFRRACGECSGKAEGEVRLVWGLAVLWRKYRRILSLVPVACLLH